MGTIPVTVQIDGPTFRRLEIIAARKHATVRNLIVAVVHRAIPADPVHDIREDAKHGRRLKAAEVATIRRLSAAGWTSQQVAAEVGCHHRTVEDWRRRFRAEAEGANS